MDVHRIEIKIKKKELKKNYENGESTKQCCRERSGGARAGSAGQMCVGGRSIHADLFYIHSLSIIYIRDVNSFSFVSSLLLALLLSLLRGRGKKGESRTKQQSHACDVWDVPVVQQHEVYLGRVGEKRRGRMIRRCKWNNKSPKRSQCRALKENSMIQYKWKKWKINI